MRGRHNDILEPDQHYLALDHDFSNLDAVLERFRDPPEPRRISTPPHVLATSSHTYAHRVRQVSHLLTASAPGPRRFEPGATRPLGVKLARGSACSAPAA